MWGFFASKDSEGESGQVIQVYYGVILRKSFVLYERWILQLRAQMFLENNLITTWLTGMDFRYGELALDLAHRMANM